MDIDNSVKVLEALANGIDPTTGEVFPSDSQYNNPEVIRALFTCIQHIKSPPKKGKKSFKEKQEDNLKKGLPKNAGLPWTRELKTELANNFQSGLAPSELAVKYERTKGSIVSELKKQGLITDKQA